MKTLVFYIKEKLLHHKTISCPVYTYKCLHMCIMNVYVRDMYICSLMFSLQLLEFKMTIPYCLSSVTSFNKADWIYLQLPHVVVFCIVIRLHYFMVSSLGLRIDIYKYICIERWRCCVTVLLYDFRDKLLGHDNPTFF